MACRLSSCAGSVLVSLEAGSRGCGAASARVTCWRAVARSLAGKGKAVEQARLSRRRDGCENVDGGAHMSEVVVLGTTNLGIPLVHDPFTSSVRYCLLAAFS